MYGWIVRNINRATTYVVKQRKGEGREIRWTSHAQPVLRHRHEEPPPSAFRRLFWLCMPGLAVLFLGFVNRDFWEFGDPLGFLCLAASLVLTVNAWVTRAHWSFRLLGVLCSLSLPLYLLIRALA